MSMPDTMPHQEVEEVEDPRALALENCGGVPLGEIAIRLGNTDAAATVRVPEQSGVTSDQVPEMAEVLRAINERVAARRANQTPAERLAAEERRKRSPFTGR